MQIIFLVSITFNIFLIYKLYQNYLAYSDLLANYLNTRNQLRLKNLNPSDCEDKVFTFEEFIEKFPKEGGQILLGIEEIEKKLDKKESDKNEDK